MSNLETLLRRWAELAATECSIVGRAAFLSAPTEGTYAFTMKLAPAALDIAALQSYVQWAVESREGWAFGVASGKEYHATVFGLRGAYWCGWSETSAAEALLSAYIKALEAQGGAQ